MKFSPIEKQNIQNSGSIGHYFRYEVTFTSKPNIQNKFSEREAIRYHTNIIHTKLLIIAHTEN